LDTNGEALTVLIHELLVPKLVRHRNQGDHVANGCQGQVLVVEFLVLDGVKDQLEATFIAKHIHEVKELLRQARVDAGHGVDSGKAVCWLDHVVQLIILLLI